MWTNQSPNAAFVAQTITVGNMTDYSRIRIRYCLNITAASKIYVLQEFNVGDNGILYCIASDKRYGRAFYVSGNDIAFDPAVENGVQSNGNLVPINIYGVRKNAQ